MKDMMNKFKGLNKKTKIIISVSAFCVVALISVSGIYALSNVEEQDKVVDKKTSTKDVKVSSKDKAKEEKKSKEETNTNDVKSDDLTNAKEEEKKVSDNSNANVSNKDISSDKVSGSNGNSNSSSTGSDDKVTKPKPQPTPKPTPQPTPQPPVEEKPYCEPVESIEGSYISNLDGAVIYYKYFNTQQERDAFALQQEKNLPNYAIGTSMDTGMCMQWSVDWREMH